MDIRKIAIKGLFGEINHEIDLSDSITILMGDNGVGKTAVLRIINAIFDKDFRYLMELEFESICIWLKNRKEGRIIYEKDEHGDILIKSSLSANDEFCVRSSNVAISLPSFIHEVSSDRWHDMRNHTILNLDELRQYYGKDIFEMEEGVLPKWYEDYLTDSTVRMIGTQRLYQLSNIGRRGDIVKINMCSRYLADYISMELSNAGKQAAELDRSFPVRLVKQMKANKKYKTEDLFDDLESLEKQRNKMSEVGFIDKEKTDLDEVLSVQNLDKTMMNVIRLYIRDGQDKLNKYQKAADKVLLFLNIINSRLKGKTLSVDARKGFVITSSKSKDKEIEADQLSSGEQNEIVLFYDLIFNCDKCSLVLIDEPEISLHLEWLQQMLTDFKKIVEQNGMKMLIATHSPDFVGDNYDLVQNLTYE